MYLYEKVIIVSH